MKQNIKNIPEGYKNSPLGIIPNEWEVKRLGELCKNNGDYGINAPATEYSKTLPTYLRITDIDNDGYFISMNKVSVNVHDDKDYYLNEGDIVFARTGATVGKSYLYKLSDGRLVFAGFLIRFTIDTRNLIPYYLKSYVSTSRYWYWVKLTSQRSGQPGINANEYCSLLVTIPPLNEQRKIAEVLSTWDKAIEKQTLLIEKLELRKKGLMQQLLTGKKRLPGFSGGAWKKVKLGDIGQCYSGLTNKNKSDFECGAAKFITYMNVFCHGKIDINILGRVNIEADEKQEKVKKGDIFFTVSSETPEEVGMSSVLMDDVNNTYLNSFCFGFRLYNNEILLPKYAIYAFRGTDMRKNMYRIAQGSTRFNLSKDEVMSLKITVPTVQEQNAIAEILSVCDNEITLAMQKLDTLRQQKKGLMQVLLTGKKRIKI